ncbi:MAG: hypothetical protein HY890_01620 [Deltaproteobacteria bacterium]|nr:hypothetical protein [Deltaproteobacteria bacterium]
MAGPCPGCKGTGAVNCPICEGSGLDPKAAETTFDAPECNYCDGLGEIPCPDCDGAGEAG